MNIEEAKGPSLNKLTKKTHQALISNDIHPHRPGKGDHYIYKCAHSGKTFTQDTGNKSPVNHTRKMNDIKKHRKSIDKPYNE